MTAMQMMNQRRIQQHNEELAVFETEHAAIMLKWEAARHEVDAVKRAAEEARVATRRENEAEKEKWEAVVQAAEDDKKASMGRMQRTLNKLSSASTKAKEETEAAQVELEEQRSANEALQRQSAQTDKLFVKQEAEFVAQLDEAQEAEAEARLKEATSHAAMEEAMAARAVAERTLFLKLEAMEASKMEDVKAS